MADLFDACLAFISLSSHMTTMLSMTSKVGDKRGSASEWTRTPALARTLVGIHEGQVDGSNGG